MAIEISREVQPFLLAASTNRPETKLNIVLRFKNDNSLTGPLFTIAEKLTLDVLLGTAVIKKPILFILTDNRKVTARSSSPGVSVK